MTSLKSPISIEQFAGYLDGNMTVDDIEKVSELIKTNDMLKSITDVNFDIESTLPLYSDSDVNVLRIIEGSSLDMPMLFEKEIFFEFSDINDDLNSSLI